MVINYKQIRFYSVWFIALMVFGFLVVSYRVLQVQLFWVSSSTTGLVRDLKHWYLGIYKFKNSLEFLDIVVIQEYSDIYNYSVQLGKCYLGLVPVKKSRPSSYKIKRQRLTYRSECLLRKVQHISNVVSLSRHTR